jgi:transcriptional regulator with XRE-family HTH domain
MTSCSIELLPQDFMERRVAKGLSLHQISTATKISVRYLEAIECGAFQKLPGGVYTESYIRQYSRAVDDTDNALLDYYHNVFAQHDAEPNPEPEPAWADRFREVVRSALGLNPDAPLRVGKRRAA